MIKLSTGLGTELKYLIKEIKGHQTRIRSPEEERSALTERVKGLDSGIRVSFAWMKDDALSGMLT